MHRSNGWRIPSEPGIKRCAARYALCALSFLIFIISKLKCNFLRFFLPYWLIHNFFSGDPAVWRFCWIGNGSSRLVPMVSGLFWWGLGIRIGAITDPGSGSSISKNTWTESEAYYFVFSKKVKNSLITDNFFLAWTVKIRLFSERRSKKNLKI